MQRDNFDTVISSNGRRIIGKLNFHSTQLLMQTMIITAFSILLIFLVNPISQIDQISYGQRVFGQ